MANHYRQWLVVFLSLSLVSEEAHMETLMRTSLELLVGDIPFGIDEHHRFVRNFVLAHQYRISILDSFVVAVLVQIGSCYRFIVMSDRHM